MIADGQSYNNIPGIVVKNNAEALSEKLFNEVTHLIPWEKINYEEYWDVYKKMYGDQWNDEIEAAVNTVRVFSRNRCPIGCKFCSSTSQLTLASNSKVPVRSITEENLVNVIDRIHKSHPGVRMIYLTDDDFIINKKSVIRFCQKIIERNFGNLKFMCFARITDLNEEVVQW
ncbi:MAG: radical SAM protein, partial [SAR202 cluster bacterium]|nr:radical SAM protein [SAR202 cluster bacterium]